MKRVKTGFLLVLVTVLMGVWIFGGCTGGGIFDGPTATPTTPVTPTTVPTVTFQTGKPNPVQIASGQTSPYNLAVWGDSATLDYVDVTLLNNIQYYVGEMVFWIESLQQGTVKRADFNRAGSSTRTTTIIPGPSNPGGILRPRALLLERELTTNDPANNVDFLYVASSSSNSSAIYRYEISGGVVRAAVPLVTGLQGEVNYMVLDNSPLGTGGIFFTVDVGVVGSAVCWIDAVTPNQPVVVLDTNVTNPHDVYIFAQDDTTGSFNQNASRFLFVTDRVASNQGRVYMYNISNWTPQNPLITNRVTISSNEESPSRLTFVPDIQAHDVIDPIHGVISVYGTTTNPSGFLYWTNYHTNNGSVREARLVYAPGPQSMSVQGSVTSVVSSLHSPYDIIGPNDFRYVFIEGNVGANNQITVSALTWGIKFNLWNDLRQAGTGIDRLYVSLNRDRPAGGNWIELTKSNWQVPGTITQAPYTTQTISYPFNGVMQAFVLVDPQTDPPVYPRRQRLFKKDLFFTTYNVQEGHLDNAIIYLQPNTFVPIP